ncbi:21485_t:CDS:2 [Cetraspora pellucida]|uniref:21485_t:CDS:1 n=1 Tax=Cetraspora pellucida TaxID=1433469 RepID=A0A9N9FGC9_9GLOM|nr:21485_t:CDS:2 [Cetraspora pellucida]
MNKITPYQKDFKNNIMKSANIINLEFVIRYKDKKSDTALLNMLKLPIITIVNN